MSAVRRTVLAAAVSAAALAGGAPGAVAAPRIYAGASSQGPVVIEVGQDGRSIERLRMQFDAECTGDKDLPFRTVARGLSIGPNGRFAAERTYAAGIEDEEGLSAELTVTVTGRLHDTRLTGGLEAQGEVRDAAGTVRATCEQALEFKARTAPGRLFGGGTSPQGAPVTIRLRRDLLAVRRFDLAYDMDCTDGWDLHEHDRVVDFRIRDGRWGDRFTVDYDLRDGTTREDRWVLFGRVRANGLITGMLRLRSVFTDADGRVTAECDTGRLTFRVRTG